ncbi:GtrA family protein [Actinomycetota bacterium]
MPEDAEHPLAEAVAGALDPAETHLANPPGQPLNLRTQLARFVATGVLSAMVDYGLLMTLTGLGLDYWWAKSLSFVAGTTTAYLINRRWTFQAEPSRARFVAVLVTYALTFALQVGIATGLFLWLSDGRAGDFWAKTVSFVVAQGIATVVNFTVQRTVIFRLR